MSFSPVSPSIRQNVYTERIIIYTICIDKIVAFIQCEYSKLYHLYNISPLTKSPLQNMFTPFGDKMSNTILDIERSSVSVIYEGRTLK